VSGRVVITCRQMQSVYPRFREEFERRGLEVEMPEVVQQLTEDELIPLLRDADGIIAGDDPLTARVIEQSPRLRIISKWGVGTDAIDKQAAASRDIAVSNTPDVFGDAVADVAMGFVLCLVRQLHRIDASVRDGGWLKVPGRTMSSLRMGIVGYGSIGRAVARRAAAFGMEVAATDVTDAAHDAARRNGVPLVAFEELLPRSDVLVLCAPLTSETHHLIDANALARLPRGAYLVNVSRGQLVDEAALVDALRSGHVAGAGLDVFEDEPLPAGSPLRRFERCIFGSHNGSNTIEGVMTASELAMRNLFSGLEL
jgi:D-3-phosphoglycerate dehydrogenase